MARGGCRAARQHPLHAPAFPPAPKQITPSVPPRCSYPKGCHRPAAVGPWLPPQEHSSHPGHPAEGARLSSGPTASAAGGHEAAHTKHHLWRALGPSSQGAERGLQQKAGRRPLQEQPQGERALPLGPPGAASSGNLNGCWSPCLQDFIFFIFCLSLQEKPRVLPNRGCTREGALLASLARWQSSHEALRAPRGGSATWGNLHRGLHLCLQVSIPLPGIYGAQQRGPSACAPLPGAASGHAAAPDSVRGTLHLGALRQHGGPKHPLWGLPASCFGASRQPGGCWHSKPAAHPTSRATGAHSTP